MQSMESTYEKQNPNQWAKSPKKQSVDFECRINKNALLQIVFLVILPTGYNQPLK